MLNCSYSMSTDNGIISTLCGSQTFYLDFDSSEDRRFVDYYMDKSEKVLMECEQEMKKIKGQQSGGKRRSSSKSTDQNGNKSSQENGVIGGKRSSDPTNSSSPPKKGKIPVDELSLVVSEDDLDLYCAYDQGYIGLNWLDRFLRPTDQTEEGNVTNCEYNPDSFGYDSRSLNGLSSEFPNRNGKQVVRRQVDYSDEDNTLNTSSVNDEGDSEKTENTLIFCLECGRSNTRAKKWPYWVNCAMCKNYYHKDCTELWRKKAKDCDIAGYKCKHCAKQET